MTDELPIFSTDERQALRELLSRRQTGDFISGEEMDARLKRMFAEKKRALGVSE